MPKKSEGVDDGAELMCMACGCSRRWTVRNGEGRFCSEHSGAVVLAGRVATGAVLRTVDIPVPASHPKAWAWRIVSAHRGGWRITSAQRAMVRGVLPGVDLDEQQVAA